MQKIQLKKGDVYYQEFKTPAFVFKGYFKGDDLIFVIDETSDSTSTNLRLVINPFNLEKWDAILENIYGLDLNEIRPKKNNLFQKLDIEYDGLNLYKNFIDNPNAGNINAILVNKEQKARTNAEKRIAEEVEILSKSQETVATTRKTLQQAQEQVGQFSDKLKNYKKDTSKNEKQIDKVQAQVYNAMQTEKMRERRLKKAEIRVKKSEVELKRLSDLLPLIDGKIVMLQTVKTPILEAVAPVLKEEKVEKITENKFFAEPKKEEKKKNQASNQEIDIELWIYVFLSLILTIFVFTSIYINNRNIENNESFVVAYEEKNSTN